ncbi:YceD family protein [Kaarinaea lacus]
MSDRFTEIIDPLALATKGRTVEGKVALKECGRLLPLLRSSEGDIEFSLSFDIDESGIPRVRGKTQATLILQCQRCMEDMEYPVVSKVRLGIVPTRKAAEDLPDNYEPLVRDDETSIVSILEDELILALPIVAMHKVEDCPQGDAFIKHAENTVIDDGNKQDSGRKNPFAVLEQLKHAQSNDKTD